MLKTLSWRCGCFALLAALFPAAQGQTPRPEWSLERARKDSDEN